MEDGQALSTEDKIKMEALKKELEALKRVHKNFARTKSKLTVEDRESWRKNSQRMDQVYVEIKDLRLKNILDAGTKI